MQGVRFRGGPNGEIWMECECDDIQAVGEALRAKLSGGRSFFRGQTFVIRAPRIAWTGAEREYLEQIAAGEQVLLRFAMDGPSQAGSTPRRPSLVRMNSVAHRRTPRSRTHHDEGAATVVTGPIRSGRRVEVPGDLLVIGDLHAGGEVVAGGNVMILGQLRGGMIHAGSYGDERAVIILARPGSGTGLIAGMQFPDMSALTAGPIVIRAEAGGLASYPLNANTVRFVSLNH